MAKEEINSLIVKPVSLAAGILGLIQGLAWTVFSILCICCHTDAIHEDASVTDTNGTEYYKYIYFLFLNGPDSSDSPRLINPREFFIFMWFYLAFSVIWTAISGTLIWAMIHNQWHLNKHVLGGWSIITVLISTVDVVLTSLLGRDYNKLNDWPGFPTSFLVCYGIVMTVAARGFILWIVNIIFAIILSKFVYDVIKNESKETTIPIIHGYETSRVNPPWFNGSAAKDLWAEPITPPPPRTPRPDGGGYQNQGFQRSHSFFPATINQNMENAYIDIPDNSRVPNNRQPQDTFAAAIAKNANKVATIGKSKGSKLNNIPPPVIPEPDYTPPGTLNGLKSVLRSKSNYQ